MHAYLHQCPLLTAEESGLPWRSWMMLRDCWEGGVLRETQCRASDSVSNTSLTSTPHILNFTSDIMLEIRIEATQNRIHDHGKHYWI